MNIKIISWLLLSAIQLEREVGTPSGTIQGYCEFQVCSLFPPQGHLKFTARQACIEKQGWAIYNVSPCPGHQANPHQRYQAARIYIMAEEMSGYLLTGLGTRMAQPVWEGQAGFRKEEIILSETLDQFTEMGHSEMMMHLSKLTQ